MVRISYKIRYYKGKWSCSVEMNAMADVECRLWWREDRKAATGVYGCLQKNEDNRLRKVSARRRRTSSGRSFCDDRSGT